ncbi:ribonuclease H-like domain-containing protein [Tanacetum coccineum]
MFNNASRRSFLLLVTTAWFKEKKKFSTIDANTASLQVSAASPNVNAASPQVCTASVSDNTMYAFMVENPNGSNVLHQDLEQIHEDDLEVMDLKWQLSLLSVRAKKYYQRTCKKIFINANDTAGYDKSKVECYNCHKLRHFAKECRAPRSKEGQFKNQDNTRKQGNNEDTSSKAMLAIDGVGFDWSDMAEEQVQTNMALMAFSDSEVYTDKTCSKTCLKNYETLKKQCDDLIVKLNQTEFTAATYKRGLATVEEQLITYRKNEVLFSEEVAVLKREVACKDYEINVLKSEFEKVKQEKDGIDFKIEKFDKASKDLDQLLGSQITDKSKKGLGYSAVPPPHPLIYNRPKKLDLSYSGLDEFKEPEFKGYGPENSKQESNVVCENESDNSKENSDKSLVKEQVSQDKSSFVEGYGPNTSKSVSEVEPKKVRKNDGAPIIEDWVSDDEEQDESKPKSEKKTVIPTAAKKEFAKPENHEKPFKKSVRYLKNSRKDNMYSIDMTAKHCSKESLDLYLLQKLMEKVMKVSLLDILWSSKAFRITTLENQEGRRNLHNGSYDRKGLVTNGYLILISNQSMTMYQFLQVEDGLNNENAEQERFVNDSSTKDVNAVEQTSLLLCLKLFGSLLNLMMLVHHVSTASPMRDNTEEEPKVDLGNITNSYIVPTTPNTRIHKDHPIDNVIGKVQSTVQTRRMSKPTSEQGLNQQALLKLYLIHPGWKQCKKNFCNSNFNKFGYWWISLMERRPLEQNGSSETRKMKGDMIRNKEKVVAQGHSRRRFLKILNVVKVSKWSRPLSVCVRHKEAWFETLVYVDDIIFGSTNKELLQQKEDGIFISQDKYVAEILKRFNYSDVKPASTPFDLERLLVKDGDADDVDVHLYRSLMYLTASRPNIMFAVCACARFQVTPKTSHLLAVKRIFRYLKGKPTLGLWYSRDSSFELSKKANVVKHVEYLMLNASPFEVMFEKEDNGLGSQCLTFIHGLCINMDPHEFPHVYLVFSSVLVMNRDMLLSSKEGLGTPRYLSLVVPLTKVGDEAVHKELGDRMERAVYASSLKALQRQFEITSKQSIDPPSQELQALVDKKRVIVTESSIRRDLHLDDAEGTDCLPTATIFEELARMGYEKPSQKLTFYKAFFSPQWKYFIHTITQCLSAKSTAWNEFSSSMASLIICLATNQKFNLSKYIFDAMVKHLDGGVKFLLYPCFLQVFINQQLGNMSTHKKIFVNPFHTKKVFANMKRAGKDFSGRITPLFDTMMVQPVEEMGEDSDHPTDSTPIHIIDQPSSSSQPKKKQPSKKAQRQEAEVPQDEAEHEESVPTPSNDPQPSGEDSLQLTDLMVLCTKLQTQVLDLQKAKDAQAKEIAALKKRIQRLERRKMSRPTGLKRLRKVGMSRRVESSEDQESLGAPEDASKQGRSIEDIDADVDVSLVDETQERQDDDLMFDTGVLEDDEMHVEAKVDGKDEQSTKPDDSTAGEAVTTASVDDSVVPTTIEEITLAQTLIQIKAAKPKVVTTAATTTTTTRPKDKGVVVQEPSEFRVPQETQPSSSKDKGKGIMIEPEVPLKRKDQIALDEQIARDIQAKLDAELLEEQKLAREQEEEANIALIESWENTQAMMEADRLLAERLQSKEREELTNEEKAKLFMELIGWEKKKDFHMGGYTYKQLKGKSFDEIQKLFDKEMKRVNTFVAMGSEVQESKEKKEEVEEEKESEEVDKVDEAELKKLLVIKKDEDIAIDAIPLATKLPVIIDYKLHKEGMLVHYQLIRAYGSSKRYSSMIRMLQGIDREDLEAL